MRYLSILIVLSMTLVMISACNGGGDGTTPVSPTFPSGKPTGVSAVAGDKSATVNWNAVSGAVGYYVYKSGDGTKFLRVGSSMVTGSSLNIYELANFNSYYFGVSAVGNGGWETSIAYPGGAPTAVEIIPEPYSGPPPGHKGNPPRPPMNLQGVAKDAAVELMWDQPALDTTPDFAHYKIYKLSQIGSFSTWPVIEDSYFDTEYRQEDLENDENVTYRITSVDTEDLESTPSNHVTLHPMDFPPETLRNVQVFLNPARVVLEWDNPEENDIAFYAVERVEAVDEGAEIVVRIVIEKPTSIDPLNPQTDTTGLISFWLDFDDDRVVVVDNAVLPGTTYTYRLSAIDSHLPDPQEGPTTTVKTPGPVF